jgi:Zn-dependent peptidase ImmA (M78 family)
LPDWWDDDCREDPRLLQDIEIRIARFLGQALAEVKDPTMRLTAPAYPGAQLRRVKDIDRDRLGPAIHSAMRIAEATIRSLRDGVPAATIPPADGLVWRNSIQHTGPSLTLKDIVRDLWARGIPVIPLDILPSPSFQGLAGIFDGRPVILLGHRYDEPGRLAFVVSHEAGHVVAGDCAPDQPVVDEEEDVLDDSPIERLADQYATRVLVGSNTIPDINGTSFKELARHAANMQRETGANASTLIFAWARRAGSPESYQKATQAVKALYQSNGARRQLRELFDEHVDITSATETDRALLRCVYGEPERHEAAV